MAGLAATLAATVYLNRAVGWRQSALFLVGTAAGFALYHAAFGFTSSWRVFISDRRGAGLRAQMLMLAVTCTVFFPLLGGGHLFGMPIRGSVAPAGVSVVVGAFLFGVGMQLGGGCASGTLFTAGGGDTRMLVTLGAFIVGSVAGTRHQAWWAAMPAFAPVSLVASLGAVGGLAICLVAFAAITWLTAVAERRRHGRTFRDDPPDAGGNFWRQMAFGPWPLAAGALALASVNVATLALAGRPWGVTSAFALWGAKALDAAGVNVAAWPYWSEPAQTVALRGSLAHDVTTVMDLGIMLGALVAAALAGRFAPQWRVPTPRLVSAIAGGLLLGYGARIAYGCNIGAYFSGIASGSLHGWLWLAAAFAGNVAGTRLRPVFGLRVERTAQASGHGLRASGSQAVFPGARSLKPDA